MNHLYVLSRYFWQDPSQEHPAQDVTLVTMEGWTYGDLEHVLLESHKLQIDPSILQPPLPAVPPSCQGEGLGPTSLELSGFSHIGPFSCLFSVSAVPPHPEGPPTSGPSYALLPSLPRSCLRLSATTYQKWGQW